MGWRKFRLSVHRKNEKNKTMEEEFGELETNYRKSTISSDYSLKSDHHFSFF